LLQLDWLEMFGPEFQTEKEIHTMSKKQKTEKSGNGPGRPSTFPAGTEVVAFPTRVAASTLAQLRELAENRKSPFGLAHNSIGAELSRIVDEAFRRSQASRKAASMKRTAVEPATEPATATEPETVTV
jgi:hypothetical protein